MSSSPRLTLKALVRCFALCLLLAGCEEGRAPKARKADKPAAAPAKAAKPVLYLTLRPAKGKAFAFGEAGQAVFTLKNLSDRAVVVAGIRPLTNRTKESVSLAGTAYGSLGKDDKAGGYSFNAMSQRATQLPFYVGLLLPDQSVAVHCSYRPLFRTERFTVSYVAAKAKYDGSAESLAPFRVFVRKAQAPGGPKQVYVPFGDAAWREICKRPFASPPGPGVGPRGVLIPNFPGAGQSVEAEVAVAFSGKAFPAEQALAAAARIDKIDPGKVKLTYSRALGGYVVMHPKAWWLLTAADQADRGKPVPVVPPALLQDADAHKDIRVRVGDKQEGLGPDKHPAGWKLWDKYPVEYGDGMYTRGEFIRTDRAGLADFLEEVRKRGLRIKVHVYYFRSRYFVLHGHKKKTEG